MGDSRQTKKLPKARRTDTSSAEVDVDLMLEVLKGETFEQIGKVRELSPEYLKSKFRMGLLRISILANENYEKVAYDNYMEYRDHWMGEVISYRLQRLFDDDTHLVGKFYSYFKGTNMMEQEAILEHLNRIKKKDEPE